MSQLTAAAVKDVFFELAPKFLTATRGQCNKCDENDFVYSCGDKQPMCKACWNYAVFDRTCPSTERRTRSAAVSAGALHCKERRDSDQWDLCNQCPYNGPDGGWYWRRISDDQGFCPRCANDDAGF